MWISVTDSAELRSEFSRLRQHPLWPPSHAAALGDLLMELTTDLRWTTWRDEAMFMGNGTRLYFQASGVGRDAVDLVCDQHGLEVTLDADDKTVPFSWDDKAAALARLAEGLARWP